MTDDPKKSNSATGGAKRGDGPNADPTGSGNAISRRNLLKTGTVAVVAAAAGVAGPRVAEANSHTPPGPSGSGPARR